MAGDDDPRAQAEAAIDAMNTEIRASFLRAFPVLEMTEAPGDAADGSRNPLAAWATAGRIIALPLPDRTVCPAFQLTPGNQPWPLLGPVLAALRPDLTPWQQAFWLVAENEWLNGATPLQAIRGGDAAVLEAARATRDFTVG